MYDNKHYIEVALNDVLGSTSLTGCNSIPAFIAAGTVAIFRQSSAPSSWTKDTSNHNNRCLRCVTGTASSGGNVAFTTAFAKNQFLETFLRTSQRTSVFLLVTTHLSNAQLPYTVTPTVLRVTNPLRTMTQPNDN